MLKLFRNNLIKVFICSIQTLVQQHAVKKHKHEPEEEGAQKNTVHHNVNVFPKPLADLWLNWTKAVLTS